MFWTSIWELILVAFIDWLKALLGMVLVLGCCVLAGCCADGSFPDIKIGAVDKTPVVEAEGTPLGTYRGRLPTICISCHTAEDPTAIEPPE